MRFHWRLAIDNSSLEIHVIRTCQEALEGEYLRCIPMKKSYLHDIFRNESDERTRGVMKWNQNHNLSGVAVCANQVSRDHSSFVRWMVPTNLIFILKKKFITEHVKWRIQERCVCYSNKSDHDLYSKSKNILVIFTFEYKCLAIHLLRHSTETYFESHEWITFFDALCLRCLCWHCLTIYMPLSLTLRIFLLIVSMKINFTYPS